MRTLIVLWMFLTLLFALYVGLSNAQQEKKKPCEMSLAEKTVQAKNLDDARDITEQKLASAQTQLYMANQTIKSMDKQIEDLKKKAEPEKKAEQ